MWHLLKSGGAMGSPNVLCGADVFCDPHGHGDKLTQVGFMSTESLKWDIICQSCAACVTPEMLSNEHSDLPSTRALKPLDRSSDIRAMHRAAKKDSFSNMLRPKNANQ